MLILKCRRVLIFHGAPAAISLRNSFFGGNDCRVDVEAKKIYDSKQRDILNQFTTGSRKLSQYPPEWCGINSSWEEMFFYMQRPVMIDATLLPYRGIIISDGLVFSLHVSFGGGIKKAFREIYSSAKTRKQILTSLDPC